MPSGIEDVVCCGAGIAVLYVKGNQEKERVLRRTAVRELAFKVLDRDLANCSNPTICGSELRNGADNNVSNAVSVIESYQEKHRIPGCEFTVPSFSLGFFTFGGHRHKPPMDIQTIVCEDMKYWLCTLAADTVSDDSGEVAQRIEFVDQLLMRPEVFSDPEFSRCMAIVCGHLILFSQQRAADMQTCSGNLGKLISLGMQVVDLVVPILLFAVLDLGKSGSTPFLNVSTLAESAKAADLSRSSDFFSYFFTTDAGRIVKELLLTQHCRYMWRSGDSSRTDDGSNPVLQICVEYEHRWRDATTQEPPDPLTGTGFFSIFRTVETSEVRQQWLELVQSIDNFIKFLSVIDNYQNLARIAGDNGMLHLRSGLHHILKELELSVGQMFQLAADIANTSKSKAAELIARDHYVSDAESWLNRLQNIDAYKLMKRKLSLGRTIQKIRFLSCEARLPELKSSCRRLLNTLAQISGSEEFVQRCKNKALPAQPVLTLVGPEEEQTTCTVEEITTGAEEVEQTTCIVEEITTEQTTGPEEVEIDSPCCISNAVELSTFQSVEPITELEQKQPITELEQKKFYAALLAAVYPFFGERLTRDQVYTIFQDTGLPVQRLHAVVRTEAESGLDADALQRIGRTIAHMQADPGMLQNAHDLPSKLPEISGLTWNAQRARINLSVEMMERLQQ